MNIKVKFTVHAAIIAALYVVLTIFISAFGLASGAIQVRISEALTILPFFTPAAVPGLFVGCLLSNLITGCAPYDVIFGSLATLIGAIGTYVLSNTMKHNNVAKIVATIPPIIANTVIVPFILAYVYMVPDSIPFLMLTVGAGEVISCGILGFILLNIINKNTSIKSLLSLQ